jgi:hypothetical protein
MNNFNLQGSVVNVPHEHEPSYDYPSLHHSGLYPSAEDMFPKRLYDSITSSESVIRSSIYVIHNQTKNIGALEFGFDMLSCCEIINFIRAVRDKNNWDSNDSIIATCVSADKNLPQFKYETGVLSLLEPDNSANEIKLPNAKRQRIKY